MNAIVQIGRLPQTYEAAKAALQKCVDLDECKKWKDQAAAVASYAKQANDETLFAYAQRIKARAIRRCGELLKQIEPARGHENGSAPTRSGTAKDAGLSERQRKTALRVASVPEADFDRQVESDNPPPIQTLADQGKTFRGASTVTQFKAATQALGKLADFAKFARLNDAAETAAGVQPGEIQHARDQVCTIDAWLDQFIVSLNGR
jgi:hypothetical protein